MIEKKTTLEINELLGMLQTLNELEYQEKREWVSVESLEKKYQTMKENKYHLSNNDYKYMIQIKRLLDELKSVESE